MILLLNELDDCLMTLSFYRRNMASTSMMKNKGKVVEESIKDQGIWIFTDTECKVDKKVNYTLNSLFQAFQDKDFMMLLHDDVSIKLSKEVYKNIIKSGLHKVVVKEYFGTLMSGCN